MRRRNRRPIAVALAALLLFLVSGSDNLPDGNYLIGFTIAVLALGVIAYIARKERWDLPPR